MAYCLFITKSYKDVFFQYMTFIELKDGFLTLNINGDIKQVKIWEQIIKCMIKTIEIGGKNILQKLHMNIFLFIPLH